MACMITASLRATATVALRWQLRLASAKPQVGTLSRPLKRVINADAASYNARRTSPSPALLMRPYTSIDVPDCHRRELSPNYAATSSERAAEALWIINHRHEAQRRHRPNAGHRHEATAQLVAGDELHHQVVQPAALLPQHGLRRQYGVHQLTGQRIGGHRLAHRFVEAVRPVPLMRIPKS